MRRRLWLLGLLLVLALSVGYALRRMHREPSLREAALDLGGRDGSPLESWLLSPLFDEGDAGRARRPVRLTPVVRGLAHPTEIVFRPDGTLLVLEQAGRVLRVPPGADQGAPWLEVDVISGGELGLLGLALSPTFAEDGRLFLAFTRRAEPLPQSVVAEYRCDDPAALSPPRFVRDVLELEQPYPNHNGGSLLFGPDGMLYVGFGDGGAAGDPEARAQDGRQWLGSILRLDVSASSDAAPYRVPTDNPFLGRPDVAPETFAIGLRNPWRMTFAPDGRLIVGDVGQDLTEELSVVRAGDNLGWDIMEGDHCFEAERCDRRGLKAPFFVFEHPIGYSITGGHVATASGPLAGLYVFGDFGTGRLWAIALPDADERPSEALALGRFPIHPSTFGRDFAGQIYVADHGRGLVYRIDP